MSAAQLMLLTIQDISMEEKRQLFSMLSRDSNIIFNFVMKTDCVHARDKRVLIYDGKTG
jgi:hypothetical protein